MDERGPSDSLTITLPFWQGRVTVDVTSRCQDEERSSSLTLVDLALEAGDLDLARFAVLQGLPRRASTDNWYRQLAPNCAGCRTTRRMRTRRHDT
jgi:hypothetical protein